MPNTKKFCVHSDGLGYCDILSDNETRQYCVESPCPHEKIVEYAPVRHGQWVKTEDGDWECTHCRDSVNICICGKDKTRYKPYCPNCGAKMDLEA